MGNIWMMPDQGQTNAAMSGQSSMTVSSACQPSTAKYHHKCCSFSKVPWWAWAWWWITRTVVSVKTLISQEEKDDMAVWEPLSLQLEEKKATHSSIVLNCGCSYCANLPPSEPHPNAVVLSPGAGGLGAEAMGDFWKDSWDFSLL